MNKNPSWKGVMAQAIDGIDVKTPLLKLARTCYKAQADNEPATLSGAWLAHAEETCAWALSADAGDGQLMDITDVPAQWVKAVAEINKAFIAGVDFTKINSYHNMDKIRAMLNRARGSEEEVPLAPGQEDDDVPILDDVVPAKHNPAEELEPEPKKVQVPKAVPVAAPVPADPGISHEDALFAAAVVDAALKSGQVLDPTKIVMCPIGLLQAVKWLDELTEGKRNNLYKGITALVKTQYENHCNEIAEGKRRESGNKSSQKRAKQEALAAVAKGKPEVITMPDNKGKADSVPLKRTPKEEDVGFSSQFADLIKQG